jgi:hypothetical protein
MATQPQNVPDQPQGISKEQLERAAIDPYYLWTGLEPEDTLPYEIVHAGFSLFIATQFRCQWDLLTRADTPWVLPLEDGLHAWSRYEATQRMAAHYREDYSAADFHELHFAEAVRAGGKLSDPEWDQLFAHKRDINDKKFFEHIALLLDGKSTWQHHAIKLFCVYWDRLPVPFRFWRGAASAVYLRESFRVRGWNTAGINAETVRQWRCRLGLRQKPPAIVRKYHPRLGITSYNHQAATLHNFVPPPPTKNVTEIF